MTEHGPVPTPAMVRAIQADVRRQRAEAAWEDDPKNRPAPGKRRRDGNPLKKRGRDEREVEELEAKLREMKASIDTKEPHTRQGGKRRNPKKEQMMEERYAQIERDNRLLLEKMSYIMRHQSMDIREDTGEYSQSLNRERRKRELQRITRENQKILARIQAAEPTYDHLEWAEHERNHEETMKRLCELPLVIHGDPAPQDEDEGY